MRPYAEIQPDVIESVGYNPRNYCLVWLGPDTNNKFCFGQAYHAKAAFLRAHPRVVERRLREAQAYKKEHPSYVIGGREMQALFPWDEGMLTGDIYEMFLEAVARIEGQKTLVTATPGEAVSDIRRLGRVLSGTVKSKSSGTDYDVTIRSIFLTPEGDIDVVVADCTCKEHTESGKKGGKYTTNVWDVHPASLGDEFLERRINPNPWKRKVYGKGHSELDVFSPFAFASNWVRQGNMLVPTSIHRAMLEVDMNAAIYLMDETYADINRKVSQLPNEYSEALVRAARRGEVRRELLRHGAKRRPEEERDLVEAEKEALRRFYAEIAPLGYEYECLYVEMGGRPAIRFENRSHAIGFVPGLRTKRGYKPPFYVVRRKTSYRPAREDLCRQDKGEANPFKQLNFTQTRFDDHTAVDEETEVRMLTRLWLPELDSPKKIRQPQVMEDIFRAGIRRWSKYPETDLKRAGLFY